MPLLRVEPHLFAMLREGFAVAAGDPQAPLDPALLNAVLHALARAEAAQLPGASIVVALTAAELAVLAACFEVGSEGLDSIRDDEWDAIRALLAQAARAKD